MNERRIAEVLDALEAAFGTLGNVPLKTIALACKCKMETDSGLCFTDFSKSVLSATANNLCKVLRRRFNDIEIGNDDDYRKIMKILTSN